MFSIFQDNKREIKVSILGVDLNEVNLFIFSIQFSYLSLLN